MGLPLRISDNFVYFLWENYIISERYKYLKNNSKERNLYFWRTTQHQEIDLIEEDGTKLTANEIKFNKNAKYKFPKTFSVNYPGAETKLITPANFETILM